MIVKVQMLAFENSTRDNIIRREVDIPNDEWSKACQHHDVAHRLDLVFLYGQNDHQPQPMCSVSVGDVIELNDELYLVISNGFKKMSPEDHAYYLTVPRRERSFSALFERDEEEEPEEVQS